MEPYKLMSNSVQFYHKSFIPLTLRCFERRIPDPSINNQVIIRYLLGIEKYKYQEDYHGNISMCKKGPGYF